jgi:AbrB family looped-hinge helix DNA binding protein
MQASVTKRGQTVIPASIRKRYQIQEGDRLVWLDDGQAIEVIPVPADSIVAALAIQKNAILLHKGPEFDSLAEMVPLEALPYTEKTGKPS